MYQMIRKSGIGEWAEPIYYRQVIAHFYIQLSVEYEPRSPLRSGPSKADVHWTSWTVPGAYAYIAGAMIRFRSFAPSRIVSASLRSALNNRPLDG